MRDVRGVELRTTYEDVFPTEGTTVEGAPDVAPPPPSSTTHPRVQPRRPLRRSRPLCGKQCAGDRQAEWRF